MSSNGRKTSITEVHNWLKQLYREGIRVYYHSDLPEHLKNRRYQSAATQMKMLIETGNQRHCCGRTREYRIPDDILDIPSNSTRLIRN